MKRIRINGLVRAANDVRRQLAGPMSAAGLATLRQRTAETLDAVAAILARDHADARDLPAPSRKAYDFLAGLDFVSVETRADGTAPPRRIVRFVGVKRHLERFLDGLGGRPTVPLERVVAEIGQASEDLERQIAQDDLQPEQLTDTTRSARGWLAFFADRHHVDTYVDAVGRAARAFQPAMRRAGHYVAPLVVHFRPMKGIFRLRGYGDCTVLTLPTPMITLNDTTFTPMAELASGRRRAKQPIIAAMTSKRYQRVQAQLEALGGIVEHTAGLYHDLDASFQRVNRAYFHAGMSRPRLTWSRTLTSRKFGHYDHVRDTVMVSASLDRTGVPAYVVDFIVYHELLHKRFGIAWYNGRAMAHTPAFRQAERLFRHYAESEAVLTELSAGP